MYAELQQGMEYTQQGMGYIQGIISSGMQQGHSYEDRQEIRYIEGSYYENSEPQQGHGYEDEQGIGQAQGYKYRQGIEISQPPTRSDPGFSKPQERDKYEYEQGIEYYILGPTRSIPDFPKPQQGNEYENPQGIEHIQGPTRSHPYISQPQQGYIYENTQGIEYIHQPTKSVPSINQPQQGEAYENRQEIEYIHPPTRSVPTFNPQQGDEYENQQGIEYIRETTRSEIYYKQEARGHGYWKHIVGSGSNNQLVVEHATENVDEQGMGIIDVSELSIWFQDVLEAVENAKERQMLQPEVIQVLEYLDLHGIQNIRHKAMEELNLFTQQYNFIEKHPKAYTKFKDLELLMKICDAVEMSRSEHLSDKTENRIQRLRNKWLWF